LFYKQLEYIRINTLLYIEHKDFKVKLKTPSTHILHPINTNNTRSLRFTATAGTKLVGTIHFKKTTHYVFKAKKRYAFLVLQKTIWFAQHNQIKRKLVVQYSSLQLSKESKTFLSSCEADHSLKPAKDRRLCYTFT